MLIGFYPFIDLGQMPPISPKIVIIWSVSIFPVNGHGLEAAIFATARRYAAFQSRNV